jgi:hypothetical protein
MSRRLFLNAIACIFLFSACDKHEPPAIVPDKATAVDTVAIKDSARRQQLIGTYIGYAHNFTYYNGVIIDTTFLQTIHVDPVGKDSISIRKDSTSIGGSVIQPPITYYFRCRDSITIYALPGEDKPRPYYHVYIFPVNADSLNYTIGEHPSGAPFSRDITFRGKKT